MAISPVGAGAPIFTPTSSQALGTAPNAVEGVADDSTQAPAASSSTGESESAQAVNQAQQESAGSSATTQVDPTSLVVSADQVLGTELGQIIDTTA